MKKSLDSLPPLPGPDDTPIRTRPDSWEEFEDSLGRLYYFHPRAGVSSWKPPRKQLNPSGELDFEEFSVRFPYVLRVDAVI